MLKEIRTEIGVVLLILYMLLLSGSVLNAVYSGLFTLNLVVTFCLTAFFIIKKSFIKLNAREIILFFFLCYLIINIIVSMIWWDEWPYLQSYMANYSFFFMSFYISRKLDYNLFVKVYVKVMVVIAIISLVCYFFNGILQILPSVELKDGVYQFYFIYNRMPSAPTRNCGIFWEPGMYQGFLAMAILFVQNKIKLEKIDIIQLIILYITIVTTYSTTGYIVMVLLFSLLLIKKIRKNSIKILIFLFLVLSAVFIVAFSDYVIAFLVKYLPEIVTKKIIHQDTSFLTRQNSVLYDMIIALQNPLGVGIVHLEEFLQNLGRTRGVILDANTNTIGKAFVYFGIIGGGYYLYIWISGVFRRYKDAISNIILFVIIMIIINTEPHLYTLFFNTLAFYWFSIQRNEV